MEETEEQKPMEDVVTTVGPDIVDLSTTSLVKVEQTEVSLNDPLFPYSHSFCSKSRKEKEQIFMKAFED